MIVIFTVIFIHQCMWRRRCNGRNKCILEETIDIEKEFEASQEKVVRVREKDEEIYKEIIGLGSDDKRRFKELSDQAMDLIG